MDFKTIPLLDNYETTLAQEWDGQVGKIKVDDLPAVSVNSEGKFEGGFTTYIIVNPDKANFQLAEIDGYDAINKTLNVINVNLLKGLGVNYNLSHHNQKSIVRISNNFAFWKKLSDVLNSKADYGNGIIEGFENFLFEVVGGNLKFKDKDNVEISLTDIAGKIGQDKKVSITGADEASFLQNKLGKGFKVVGNNQNKKVDVDYRTIDFSLVEEENFNEDIFLVTGNNKKIKIKNLYSSNEDFKNLQDNKKIITNSNIKNFFENENFLQEAFPSNILRFSLDTEVSADERQLFEEKDIKKVHINFSGKIKLSFDFKLNYLHNSRISLIQKRKETIQINRDIERPIFKDTTREIILFEEAFLNIFDSNTIQNLKNFQTKNFENIEVKKGDILYITISGGNRFTVRNFRLYFSMKKLNLCEEL